MGDSIHFVFLVLFIIVHPSFCTDTLDTLYNDDSDVHNAKTVILIKDTLTNAFAYVNDKNQVVSLNYLATNYSKCLDTCSYEYKKIRQYQSTRALSAVGYAGFGFFFVISMFTWELLPPQKAEQPYVLSMSTPIGVTVICSGLAGVGFKYISNRILNRIVQKNSK